MRKTSRRGTTLRIESLEDRRVPATWGIPWADPQHLTASFVPDGTSLPGGTSSLNQMLDGQLGAGNWEVSILKALQTWAVNSNLNVGLVADGGQPVGVAGLAQSDARFGDIRIGAEPLSSDVLAITTPYNPGGGTLSGDVIINSNDDFNPSDPGSYDLSTVLLHEAGHVFGFADSSDPTNFMYNVYQGPQTSLPAGAVPALQSLYGGPRNVDSLDKIPASTSPSSPINIPTLTNTSTSVSLPGDLASAQTANDFTFQTPKNSAVDPLGIDVTVQTGGISLLAPRLTVYALGQGNALGAVVATASASGPLDGGASVHLGGLIAGQKYVVQVQGATGDVFSVGSYNLTVSETGAASGGANPTSGSKAIQEPGGYNGSTPLTVTDTISGSNEVDVYSFKTPASLTSILSNVNVSLQDWGFGLTAPSVAIYNSAATLVGSATASDPANSSVNVQLTGLLPNSTYYVRVTDGTINPMDFGTYQVTVGFGTPGPAQASGFLPAAPWFGSSGATPGQPNNSIPNAATLQTPAGAAPQSLYEAVDGVAPAQPVRFYKLASPKVAAGQAEVMTISIQTLGTDALAPWITVYDQQGNPLNVQSLTEQDGIGVVQVTLPTPGGQYYVGVAAAPLPGASSQGNYVLDTTFGSALAVIGPLASGIIPAGSGAPAASTTLTIAQGELFWFDLAGTASNPSTDAMIQMTLLDASGNVVTTLSTAAGLASSTTTFLAPGVYTVAIGAYSPSGAMIPSLGYTLVGTNNSDPLRGILSTGSGGGTR